LQYATVQAIYNWNCCGISVGYRRFDLGSVRNETQYLYSFTLANFGAVGDIRRANSPSRPTLPRCIRAFRNGVDQNFTGIPPFRRKTRNGWGTKVYIKS